MQTEKNSTAADEIDIYRELEEYPWDQDREFQVSIEPQFRSSLGFSTLSNTVV